MFYFICRVLRNGKSANIAVSTLNLFFLQFRTFSSAAQKSVKPTTNQLSFTVAYLINSCGLTPESAISASKRVIFKSSEKPDSVLELLKSHGFTETQISIVVQKFPLILFSNPERTILPKLEFFYSKGLTETDVAKIVCRYPFITARSLKNKIIPAYNLVKNLFQSEEKAIYAVKRSMRLLTCDFQTCVLPNLEILRKLGVPEDKILLLLRIQPRAFIASSDRFRDTVEEVKKMGINPLKSKFVLAIHALRAMHRATWEKKVEVYKKWGWSEEKTIVAFGKHLGCMTASEDKITKVMDFFINKMGWDPSTIAEHPLLISLSLEKRIIPRSAVYQVVLSRGLLKKDISWTTTLKCSESSFMERVVMAHKEEASELLRLYQEKMDLANNF